MRTLIFGCGYLGHRVAARLVGTGGSVSAVTRSDDRAAVLRGTGIEPLVADIMTPASLLNLPAVDRVLYCVGFDRSGAHSKRDTYVGGLSNVLAALPDACEITYVSSTSVYGQADGEWIDEDSATEPATEGGKICLEAEQLLSDRNASIVRLAGIYGPDRVLRKIDSLRTAEPIAGNPDSYLNLIHVADAARLVHRVLDQPQRAPVYLGCDGHPATRRDFYSALARLLKAAEPAFDPTLPARHGNGGINKRCRSRLLASLSFEPDYPGYTDGLPSCIEATE